jgi:L-fuconate dehydratase
MSIIIRDLLIRDIRFPTSDTLAGSDAVHKKPDYSCAYVTLFTNEPELNGFGLTFTIGRGTEVVCKMLEAFRPLVVGRSLSEITEDFTAFTRSLSQEDQLRWLGPEVGVINLAAAAIINAVWDLWARAESKPVWKLLVDLEPEQIINCIDWRYIDDALSRDEARAILKKNLPTNSDRQLKLKQTGIRSYNTAGWLGYSDDKLRNVCRDALAEGWSNIKIKVGVDQKDDLRRLAIVREEIGPSSRLMIDANQIWGVDEAVDKLKQMLPFDLHWVEEPTNPNDVLGYQKIARSIAPTKVAGGEHFPNRIIFKQMLQSGSIGFAQIDSCRVAGVNENLAIILMAAKYGVPVCPHAGGVGLCNLVQHLAAWDQIGVSARSDVQLVEYTEILQESFVTPIAVKNGHYRLPETAGYGIEIKSDVIDRYSFPTGDVWADR